MHEEALKTSLHQIVDEVEIPSSMWTNIESKLDKKTQKFRIFKKLFGAAACFCLLTFIGLGSITPVGASIQKSVLFQTKLGSFTLTLVQNVGQQVAGITPTLFLPTTLSNAKQVAKMSIKTPTYLPEGIEINSDTPTLVGRFGKFETVAIKVSEKVNHDPSAEIIILDIRQTTSKDLEANYPPDIKITTKQVKINNNDGLLVSGRGLVPMLYWTDGEYSFRLTGPNSKDKDELIKIAESMQ